MTHRLGRRASANAKDVSKPFWTTVLQGIQSNLIASTIAILMSGLVAAFFFLRDKAYDRVAEEKNISAEAAMQIAHRYIGSDILKVIPFRDREHNGQMIAVWARRSCDKNDTADQDCREAQFLNLLVGFGNSWVVTRSDIIASDEFGQDPGTIVDWNQDGRKEILSKAYSHSADGETEDVTFTLIFPEPRSLKTLAVVSNTFESGILSSKIKAGGMQEVDWLSKAIANDMPVELAPLGQLISDWVDLNGRDFVTGDIKIKRRNLKFDPQWFDANCSARFGDTTYFSSIGGVFGYDHSSGMAYALYRENSNFLHSVHFDKDHITFYTDSEHAVLDVNLIDLKALEVEAIPDGPIC